MIFEAKKARYYFFFPFKTDMCKPGRGRLVGGNSSFEWRTWVNSPTELFLMSKVNHLKQIITLFK